MEEEQTMFENWLDEYEQTDQEVREGQIDSHLDEYVKFNSRCVDNKHIENWEIPMLWVSWCIRRSIK